MFGILIGHDDAVANWAWKEYNLLPIQYICAIGILDKDGNLVGAGIYNGYNHFDVQFSYYGKNTLTPGLIRTFATIAVENLNVARATLIVSKKAKRRIRGILKLGFKVEGVQRCFYGPRDCTKNTGVRLVIFREDLEKLAKIPAKKELAIC